MSFTRPPSALLADVRHLRSTSYKDSACPSVVPGAVPVTAAEAFITYQTHSVVQDFWAPYVNASSQINASGKDFVSESIPCTLSATNFSSPPSHSPVLETNTASCGGFAGASDSFAAGLYLVDIALQAASIGVAQVLLHNGGSGQFYNPFTPPPGNMSSFREWSTAAPYYSALIMAEAMAEQNSQVQDLLLNNNSTVTPGE